MSQQAIFFAWFLQERFSKRHQLYKPGREHQVEWHKLVSLVERLSQSDIESSNIINYVEL